MGPFVIVIAEILGNLFLPEPETLRNAIDALILDGAIKPFKMGVVVWGPDARMSVTEAALDDALGEPLRELAAVVGLDGLEIEGRGELSALDEGKAAMGRDAEGRSGVRPAGEDIEHGVDVQLIARCAHVDGIDFDENSWLFGNRPRWVAMPLLPWRGIRKQISFERPLHG